MNIVFVNNQDKRIMTIDFGEEVDVAHMTEQQADLINLFCDTFDWHWELLKQPRKGSRVLSYQRLLEVCR
jgi:hypothetical protein